MGLQVHVLTCHLTTHNSWRLVIGGCSVQTLFDDQSVSTTCTSCRIHQFQGIKVQSVLTNIGADLLDGMRICCCIGGGTGPARAPDVSIIKDNISICSARGLDDVTTDSNTITTGAGAAATPAYALRCGVTLTLGTIIIGALVIGEVDDGDQGKLLAISNYC